MFNKLIITMILIGSLGTVPFAQAEPCGCPPQHHPGDAMPAFERPGIPPHIKDHLNLTEEQQKAMDKIMKEEQAEAHKLIDELMKKRLELMEWAGADIFDEQLVRTLAGQIAQMEADLTVLRLETRNKINKQLTDKQKEQLRQTEKPNPHGERMPKPSCPPSVFHRGIGPLPR